MLHSKSFQLIKEISLLLTKIEGISGGNNNVKELYCIKHVSDNTNKFIASSITRLSTDLWAQIQLIHIPLSLTLFSV